MNYNFAIQQDGKPSTLAAENDLGKSFHCYSVAADSRDYDDLALGRYPEKEQFRRITVNGDLPLAAWLQVNTTVMGVSRNILTDAAAPKGQTPVPVDSIYWNEAVDGGQMSYIFTVQYSGGIDAKFSLTSNAWNPLAVDASASMVQTGVLSLYVNGFMAATALGAKSGVVLIPGKGTPAAPQKVFVVNYPPGTTPPPSGGTARMAPEEAPDTAERKGALPAQKKRALPRAVSPGPRRGQFITPVTPFVLTPGP